jgi:hypothetical protein
MTFKIKHLQHFIRYCPVELKLIIKQKLNRKKKKEKENRENQSQPWEFTAFIIFFL